MDHESVPIFDDGSQRLYDGLYDRLYIKEPPHSETTLHDVQEGDRNEPKARGTTRNSNDFHLAREPQLLVIANLSGPVLWLYRHQI